MRILTFFIFFIYLQAFGQENSVISSGNKVKVIRISDSGQYEILKKGKKKIIISVQDYQDIQRLQKYTKSLGHTIPQKKVRKIKQHLESDMRFPTPDEKAEVALYQLKEANKIIDQNQENSCLKKTPNHTALKENKSLPPKKWFCACNEPDPEMNFDLESFSKEKKDGLFHQWVGNNVDHFVSVDTFNDNPLHGGASLFFKEPTADDVGRTFGLDLEYGASGDTGDFSIGLEKHLFSRRVQSSLVNGNISRFDEKNRRFGEATEETSLSIFGRKKYKSFYLAGELELTEETDKNRGLQSLQNTWHAATGSAEYNYLDHGESRYSIKPKVGVSKKFDKDIGKWKCRLVSDALIGTDLMSPSDVELTLRNRLDLNSGSFGGREKENPWIGISALTNHEISANGVDSHYGGKLYTSFKAGDTIIQPHYGLNFYDQALDRSYQNLDGKSELIHSLGVTIRF